MSVYICKLAHQTQIKRKKQQSFNWRGKNHTLRDSTAYVCRWLISRAQRVQLPTHQFDRIHWVFLKSLHPLLFHNVWGKKWKSRTRIEQSDHSAGNGYDLLADTVVSYFFNKNIFVCYADVVLCCTVLCVCEWYRLTSTCMHLYFMCWLFALSRLLLTFSNFPFGFAIMSLTDFQCKNAVPSREFSAPWFKFSMVPLLNFGTSHLF